MKTQTRWLFPFVMMFMVCALVPDRALADVKSLADPDGLSLPSNGQYDLRGRAGLDLENAQQVFCGMLQRTFEPN